MSPLNQTNNFQALANLVNQAAAIGLKQINGFEMVKSFQDSSGRQWKLVKSARDAGVEIPDPNFVQITDYWNHEFPDSAGKVFIYVVEGIKRPRTETEQPVMVLYQWFSTNNNPNFTPQMITLSEWYAANVYTSSVSDDRVSKLCALCKVSQQTRKALPEEDIDISLIRNGNDKPGRNDRANSGARKD